ncbi:MAG: GH92 family glycosyl hydrolase [Bacteroidetes bacterium]|nr:GH92 family glycosyl hydrolase [Bacteroidota bacterium]
MRNFLTGIFLWSTVYLSAQSNPVSDFLPFVNPFIGTDAHGHTYPGATAPFGMVQLSPDTRPSTMDWDGCSGYHYSDSLIFGFSHTHLNGTGVPDYCDLLFLPFTGKAFLESSDNAAPFDKSDEHAEAGYYRVMLKKSHILAELTATTRVGVHRYTFPANQPQAHLLVDLRHRDVVLDAQLEVINDHEIAGFRVSSGWAKTQHFYFVARFSQPFTQSRMLDMTQLPHVSDKQAHSTAVLGLLDFNQTGAPIVVTVGVSGVSIEAARRNLEAECPHFDFDQIKMATQTAWRNQLAKIEVEGGTKDQKTTFYTALYHTMLTPNTWSDVDGSYRGRDLKIHSDQNHTQYTVFSLWDTYRACNPLYTLLHTPKVNDFIHTFLHQYQEGGLLPVWELAANETDCMIGNHAIPVIVDAYLKGIGDFDPELALKAMIKSADSDRYGLSWYRTLGFIPSDEEPESVSKTLEYAFDDWCIAQMALKMGKTAEYTRFIQRAQFYKNLFDPQSGFFRGKNNASWHQPFDPFEVNFNYTEANAWQYRFAAPQDISGMMRLLGGKDRFADQLDSLFTVHSHTHGREQADITGLIGQYAQGNEPSHHMAYLYNYVGQPWKTQQRVREIMDKLYTAKPDGLSGNEDCGQMSAWLVWSAMGFYPAVPGSNQYIWGTPWFDKIVLHLDNGKTFMVSAKGASGKNHYIQNMRWDGAPRTQNSFSHTALMNGAQVVLEMGENPSKWGTAETDCPVSAITSDEIVPAPFIKTGARVFSDQQEIQLACIDPQASLYYSFDPNAPLNQFSPYKKAIKLNQSAQIAFFAQKMGKRSAIMQAQFSKLQTNWKIVRYNTRYDNQYTARGDQGLIDQLRGGADFRSGSWQGYQGQNLDVILDLGKITSIDSVGLGCLQDENSWIFFPLQLKVACSTDGIQYQEVGIVKNDVPFTQSGVIRKDYWVKMQGKAARFVHVVGSNVGVCPSGHKGAGNPCWLFADEILIQASVK